MGEVWRARDPALRRDVAVKVLRREGGDGSATLRDDFVQRFLREARAAASLKHPNIVAIHDVGVDEEPYIVMEYVEGSSLRGFIGDQGVPIDQRIAWLVEIARALAAAHEIGLVHRDVKPDNVMITKDGHAKVLDFGIAKAIGMSDDAPVPSVDAPESFRTQQGRVVGTPKYMAPEQLRGDPIDARVDQWAWACVAYELLTGSMPDRGETPQPISLTVPAVPFDVAAAIVRARSDDPAKRFDTMRTLLSALSVQPSGEIANVSSPARRNPDAPTTTGPVRRPWRRVALVASMSFVLAAGAVFAQRRLAKRAVVAEPPKPACTFEPLAPVPLGPLPLHVVASGKPIVGGTLLGILRSEEGINREQLVTITPSEVTSRLPAPPDRIAGHPNALFTLSTPNDVRHYLTYGTEDGSMLVVGRTTTNDAVVDVSRIPAVEGFTLGEIAGFYSHYVSPPSLTFLLGGHEPTHGMISRPSIRLHGRSLLARAIYTGADMEDEPRAIVALTSGDHVAYTFSSAGKLYAGSIRLTGRTEESTALFGVPTRFENVLIDELRVPRALGETGSHPGRAFARETFHVLWTELGAARLHHTSFRTDDADAGTVDETFDVPTDGSSPELRVHDDVFMVAWHDGARVYYGEGDSVRRAISRAAWFSDTAIFTGPWIAHTASGTLVSWVSGTNNDVRRAIVTCR